MRVLTGIGAEGGELWLKHYFNRTWSSRFSAGAARQRRGERGAWCRVNQKGILDVPRLSLGGGR